MGKDLSSCFERITSDSQKAFKFLFMDVMYLYLQVNQFSYFQEYLVGILHHHRKGQHVWDSSLLKKKKYIQVCN
jgi:hypothetical protein